MNDPAPMTVGVVHVLGSVSALNGTAISGGGERRPVGHEANSPIACCDKGLSDGVSIVVAFATGPPANRDGVKEPG